MRYQFRHVDVGPYLHAMLLFLPFGKQQVGLV